MRTRLSMKIRKHLVQAHLGTRDVLVGTDPLLWDPLTFTEAFSEGCLNEGRQKWYVEACLSWEQMGSTLSMTY